MSNLLSVVAYLLPVIGAILVLLLRRDDQFAMFHARQAVALLIMVLVVIVVWAVVAWIALWVPLVGPLVAAATFAIVIVVAVVAVVDLVIGVVSAIQGKTRQLPLVGRWLDRVPF